MKPRNAALLLALALCAMAFAAVAILRHAQRSERDVASSTDDLAFRPHLGTRLPLDVEVRDEAGRAAPLGVYFNKTPVILVLEYLKCRSLCTVTLQALTETLSRLPLKPARDYQLVALSIDPRDRPEDASAARDKYAGRLGASGVSGLHFLVAGKPAIEEISEAVGFPSRYDKVLDAYIHPAGFVIASADGVIRRYVEGVSLSTADLVSALADAQQNRTEGLLARIVLLCHIENAPTGRFTVPVLGALMAANLAAGLTLIALFTVLRRRGDGDV